MMPAAAATIRDTTPSRCRRRYDATPFSMMLPCWLLLLRYAVTLFHYCRHCCLRRRRRHATLRFAVINYAALLLPFGYAIDAIDAYACPPPPCHYFLAAITHVEFSAILIRLLRAIRCCFFADIRHAILRHTPLRFHYAIDAIRHAMHAIAASCHYAGAIHCR